MLKNDVYYTNYLFMEKIIKGLMWNTESLRRIQNTLFHANIPMN